MGLIRAIAITIGAPVNRRRHFHITSLSIDGRWEEIDIRAGKVRPDLETANKIELREIEREPADGGTGRPKAGHRAVERHQFTIIGARHIKGGNGDGTIAVRPGELSFTDDASRRDEANLSLENGNRVRRDFADGPGDRRG